jgi:2,4-dienoyl-CoA reductase-like NADH-dependent reductase (Old Yellow Enzyme family)
MKEEIMPGLFEGSTIKGLSLPNRFVRSATWEGMAGDDGSCTGKLVNLMVELARGEVGLIITGHSFVSREGQAGPWQLGVYSDDLLPGLACMVDAVHRAGGKIILQLAHAGYYGANHLTGLEPLGPSILELVDAPQCRMMTKEDIQIVCTAFARAARLAKRAGFDGIQIHAAHGFLLSEFLSPFFNRRSDEYGGSVENRARILLEVLENVKKAVRDSWPVIVKINSEDFVDGGLTVEDMVRVCALLEKAGVDAIEMSGGTIHASGRFSPARMGVLETPEEEVYYRDAATLYKEKIKVPLILVGGIRSFEVAEKLVADGLADYISLCRPLIREPALVKRWKAGDRRKATCQSDNRCFEPTVRGDGLYCVVEKESKR